MNVAPPSAAAPPVNADQSLISAFRQLVADKTPYVWGGVTQLGADCSGAMVWVFNKAGFSLGNNRTSQQQAELGTNITLAGTGGLADAQAGDVLFFNEPGEGVNSHEAMYAGNGMDYELSQPGTVAHLVPVDTTHLSEIRRFVTAAGTPLAGIDGTAEQVPAPAGADPTTATLTSFDPLSASSWLAIGMKVVFVAGGLGLVVLGVSKTASPA